MSDAARDRSTDWVTLEHDGAVLAETWFMPEGHGHTAVFLIPRERLAANSPTPASLDMLLAVAGITTAEVESWRLGDDSQSGTDAGEFDQPLPPAAEDDPHLTVYVRLKPPADEEPEDVPLEKWQALDSLWSSILGLESGIDVARLGMESLRSELDAAFKRPLAVEEKLHALQADVAQWTKAKSRVHHALPKAREFVHRATWSLAVPERKHLEEIMKAHVVPRLPFRGVDRVRERLEHFQKDRQVLLAQGNAVQQDCRGTLSEVQRALSSLQRNSADRARQKRSAGREKGKHF